MTPAKRSTYRYLHSIRNWMASAVDPVRFFRAFPAGYLGYLRDWWRYSRIPGAEPIRCLDAYPQLHDRTEKTPGGGHYFYQDIWAFRRILNSGVTHHVDIGSRVLFVGFLGTIIPVTFIDIRPPDIHLDGLEFKPGSILDLPYDDQSVMSLSCLHVAEHIGLGRYGDPLDPDGTIKAAKELARILAPGGNLYFSVPVGRVRTCFNAHRIFSPQTIREYFSDLNVVEFSGIRDDGRFVQHMALSDLAESEYACGLFWFRRQ